MQLRRLRAAAKEAIAGHQFHVLVSQVHQSVDKVPHQTIRAQSSHVVLLLFCPDGSARVVARDAEERADVLHKPLLEATAEESTKGREKQRRALTCSPASDCAGS